MRCRSALIIALVLAFAVSGPATADEDLWTQLGAGGHVILIRHTVTTPGSGDPPGMSLEDCATQRNLTDEGRDHARAIGVEIRRRRIPIRKILSSPWCRCLETARLAFGWPELSSSLGNLFGRPENRDRQVRAMTALVSKKPRGGNLVLVSHGSTIQALTGVAPDTGEMVVVRPLGGGRFDVAGRLLVPPVNDPRRPRPGT